MSEHLSRFERVKRIRRGLAITMGAVATIFATTGSAASCGPNAITPPASTTQEELADCLINGRAGDPDPDLLTKGEAISIFPGRVEIQNYGVVDVRPVVQLGENAVLAAYELVHVPEKDGFRLTQIDRDHLRSAVWKLDDSIGDPGDPGAMTKHDECTPGNITGRVKLFAQYVTLKQGADTPLTDKPYPGGHVLTVPLYKEDKDGYLAISQWQEAGVFGAGLGATHARELNTGVPMLEVAVPVS